MKDLSEEELYDEKTAVCGAISSAADAENESEGKGSDRSVPLSCPGVFDQSRVTRFTHWMSKNSARWWLPTQLLGLSM